MDLSEIIKKIKPSVPMILRLSKDGRVVGTGSGFVFQEKGTVVTCAHVVRGENFDIKLKFPDNADEVVDAKVVLTDEEHDLALLSYVMSESGPSPLKEFKGEVSPGMPIIFSGYPLGIATMMTHQGMISSVTTDSSGVDTYSIDGTVNPGNSGGVLMTVGGEVVGIINSMRQERADIIREARSALSPGLIQIMNLDVSGVLNAIMSNLQLGIGYAVPAYYIPERTNAKGQKQKIKKEDK